MTTKLTFRARTLDVAKPLLIYFAQDLPDLTNENAINRAVPALPTGMEKEEETEKHLQDILEAQTKGLVKKVAELVIPTPEVMDVSINDYDFVYKGEFKQGRQYIHVQPFNADQDQPDYDLDEEDVAFFNDELRERKKFEVSMVTFEDMIDRLEKNSGQTVVSLKEAKMLLKEDDDLILAVYDYWLNKRLETQECLIPLIKSEPNRDSTEKANPYIAFRRRTEKMQTRKNRKNEEDSYIRMLKLRRDTNRVLMLLDLVKRREKLKKENLNLNSDIFDKRYQANDWEGHMLQQVQALRPAQSKNFMPHYPLNSWMRNGLASDPQHDFTNKRDKKLIKKRKRHRSGLMKSGVGAIIKTERSFIQNASDPASSDDDRVFYSAVKQSPDHDLEDPTEVDNPFAFRRKAGVEYCAPIDSMMSDFDEMCQREQKQGGSFSPALAPVALNRSPDCLGWARRRVGRGGRVVIDRIPSRWEPAWHNVNLNHTDFVRPATPTELKFISWDPYKD